MSDVSPFPRSQAFFAAVPSDRRGGILEEMLRECYRQILKPGDLAVDGGAHSGFHTIPMAQCVVPGGKVVAVEALSRLVKGPLADAIRNAGLEDTVRVADLALGPEAGQSTFQEFAAAAGFSGLIARTDLPEEIAKSRIEHVVQVVTLDTLVLPQVAQGQRVRFMKLDLEGGEVPALFGARQLIREHEPVVIFEFGGPENASLYGFTREMFFDFFKEIGYQVSTILGEPVTAQTWGQGYCVWYVFAAKTGTVSVRNILSKAETQVGLMLPPGTPGMTLA